MTKVQAQMIAIAIKRNDKTLACKLALMANIEADGRGVFLANAYADVSNHVAPVEWRSALSVLARQGFYRASQDAEYVGKFGYITQAA